MIIPPFSDATVLMARAVLSLTQERPVQTLNGFACRLANLGRPGPYRSSPGSPGLVVDRDGHMLAIVSPEIPGAAGRRAAAEITALALNRLCELPAAEDRLAAAQVTAVPSGSARFAAQGGPVTEAGA